MKRFTFLLAFCALGLSQCTTLPIDQSVEAAEGNDMTLTFQAPGVVSQKGYLFFQQSEGTELRTLFKMTTPPVKCSRDSCAKFQFFRKDGTPSLSGGIKKGDTVTAFKLADVVGHVGPVQASDEGEYSVMLQLYYTGNDGKEYTVYANGFIRVNVLKAGYMPIGCNDPSVAWKVPVAKDCETQYTTSYRSAVCGTGCTGRL